MTVLFVAFARLLIQLIIACFVACSNISVGKFMMISSGPTERAKRCVDAKINTLESDGKCSPSHGKSTKRASQFDLKLTREKTKSNSRAYRLGFQISLTQAYWQALPIQKTIKEY